MMKCGFITIIGKTNVGKSTFLNAFIGKKVSITSKKSQTTRSNIYAVKTTKSLQAIFIDTPGIHLRTEKALNKVLRKKPLEAINDIDVILYMVSGTKFDQVDQDALNLIKNSTAKKILLINKNSIVWILKCRFGISKCRLSKCQYRVSENQCLVSSGQF